MRSLLAVVAVAGAGLLAVAGAGLLAAGCGSESAVSLGKPAPATTTHEQTGSGSSPLSLEVWFARDGGLVAAHRAHAATQAVATAAITDLLDGPTSDESSAG